MTERHQVPMPKPGEAAGVRVFLHGERGGNPVPLVADARGLSAEDMQRIASDHGHESAFVLPPTHARADWRLRFFVPQHEMEMCGHATVGSLWALRQWGAWRTATALVETLSGLVEVRWDEALQRAWVSQPRAVQQPVSREHWARVAAVLGVARETKLHSVVNASTSRVKTLVRLESVEALQALLPDFDQVEALCTEMGSTGLYPYAPGTDAGRTAFARQFPKSSGYPEDPATGIAAAALWGHLVDACGIDLGTQQNPAAYRVRQGDAMGHPSAIEILPRFAANGEVAGCWLSGRADWTAL